MDTSRNKILGLHLHTLACSQLVLKHLEKRKKKWWVHPIWIRRESEGAYNTLVKSLRSNDHVFFKKYLRMSPKEFDKLKKLVHPLLKKNPAGRPALSVGHRLAIVIRYLASGDSMMSIAFAFRVGFSTVHMLVKEVCDALWKAMKSIYLPVPTEDSWNIIADGFWNRWQFPNCVGVVDGKHVEIQAPPKSGSTYFNYKGHYSIVLMAVVDSDYKFIVADVGGFGSNSDGGLWKASKFGKGFDSGNVNIPSPRALPNSDKILPFVLLGDAAFQLRNNFMRPFPGSHLCDSRRIFNYRLSRARRCVENAFGILAARWRILLRAINLKPQNVDRVVRATLILHNFLKTEVEKSKSSVYCPDGFADHTDSNGNIVDGDWRQEVVISRSALKPLSKTASKNFSSSSCSIRQLFLEYFNTSGSVPWQVEAAGVNEIYI